MKTIGVLVMFVMTYGYTWASSDTFASCIKEVQLGPLCTDDDKVPATEPLGECFIDLSSTTYSGLNLCTTDYAVIAAAMTNALTSSGLSVPGIAKK